MATSPFGSPSENPYQSPAGGEIASPPPETSSPKVTARAIEFLRQTRPWVRFLSVVGYVCAVFMMIAGLVGGGLGLVAGGGGSRTAVLLVYIPMSLLYIVPSMYLWRYADRIKDLQLSQHVVDMESALEAQKSFWRFMGITVLVVLILYALVIVSLPILMIALDN